MSAGAKEFPKIVAELSFGLHLAPILAPFLRENAVSGGEIQSELSDLKKKVSDLSSLIKNPG